MNPDKEIFIPNQQTRKKLSEKLNLEFDENMQDWEWEISDPNRIAEFINEYDNLNSSKKEKETLMEIILDSLNDMERTIQNNDFEKYLNSVIFRLKENYEIHRETIKYWKYGGFDISDFLKI
jgi:chorismate mutase